MAKRNIGAVAQSFLGVPAKADTTPKTEEPKKVVPVEKPKAEPKPIEKKTMASFTAIFISDQQFFLDFNSSFKI